jgi:hypothetical protein
MVKKVRSIRKAARKAGVAKSIFKRAAGKLRMPKSLPHRGARPPSRSTPPSGWVKRLPSGRYPANYRWAGRVYKGKMWTAELATKYPNGVRFNRSGFPDFGPYSKKTIRFKKGFTGDRGVDDAAANRLFPAPDGYTWHHHQDGKTMQLIPTDLHDAVRHGGGVAVIKGK